MLVYNKLKSSLLLLITASVLYSCSPSQEELLRKSREKMGENAYSEAVKYLSQVIEVNESNLEALNMRGVAYVELGEYNNAISDFNMYLSKDSATYKPYYNRGIAFFAQGAYEKALLDFNKAIQLQPNLGDLYLNRANALTKLEQYQAALSDYKFVLKVEPSSVLANLNSAKALIELGQLQSSKEYLQQALEADPSVGEIYYWIGYVEINSGNQQKGCDALVRAKNRGYAEAQKAIKEFCE